MLVLSFAVFGSSCDSSLEGQLDRRISRELKRFPTGLVFDDAEHPGARDLGCGLMVVAPVIGRGLGVPNATPRADGARDCPRWGWWTYHYVKATEELGPDGKTRWHFTREPPLGLEAEGEYEANEPNGPWSFWHPNGQLRAQGSFVKGSVEGTWTVWSDSGVIDAARTGNYAAGKLVRLASGGSGAR